MTIVNTFLFEEKLPNKHCCFGGTSKENISDKDKKILKQLFGNARATNFEIWKNTNLSPTTVKKRIESMEQRGIIRGYSPFFHSSILNIINRRIPLRLNDISNAEERLIEFANAEKNIIVLEKLIGEWNYELRIECNDKAEFLEVMRKLKDSFSDVLIDYEIIDVNYNYGVNFEGLLE